MDINEVAKEFKYKGVFVRMDDAAKAFAIQWANLVLADYLASAGMHQINMAKRLAGIKDDERKSFLVA